MTPFAADAANALYTASSCVARQLVAMQERCAFRLLGVPVAPPIEPARRARSAESGNQTCKEMNGEKKLREAGWHDQKGDYCETFKRTSATLTVRVVSRLSGDFQEL